MPESLRTGDVRLVATPPEPSLEIHTAADRSSETSGDAPAGPARPLRILQVSHDLKPGGLQRVVLDLAFGLKALGHEAHVCSLRGPGPLLPELEHNSVSVHVMPWPERGADHLLFLKVLRMLRTHAYDVVHTHNTQAFLDGGLAACLARVPVRIHTDHARPFPDKKRYMLMERVASWGYHKVVGVSAHTADNLRKYEGISRSRLAVIRNGIDGSRYRRERERADVAALRRQHGLDGFSRVFGLGVRLEEQKGIRYLLSAMPRILRRHPDVGLAIAGGGSLEGPLKAQARALGVAGNVRFLGSFPSLDAFYPLIDFFVLPSLWEGLPLCLLEAMSLDLPIVATAVGGVGEILTDRRSALLVPPGDPESLAGAVGRIVADFAAAQAMGREGRRLFDSRYDAAVMVREYLELYHDGLRRRGLE